MPKANVKNHIGIMLMSSFSSSTFVTVASFHGLSFSAEAFSLPRFSIIAALSRNLQKYYRC